MDLHLVSHKLCPYVQRAAIVLREKGAPFRRTDIDLAHKPDWFLKISPLGRTPALVADGRPLFESQVIAEFVDEITDGSLHPSDPLSRARHRAWIAFGSETLKTIAAFYSAADAAGFADEGERLVAKVARAADEVVGPYFDGDAFHMIDGVWATIFRYFDVFEDLDVLDIGGRLSADGARRLDMWRRALRARPSARAAAPDDYPERLAAFLHARPAHLAQLMRSAA